MVLRCLSPSARRSISSSSRRAISILVDPPDERGRRQTTNAFVIYVAATALVLWADATGRLIPWREVPWPLVAAAAMTLAAYTVYLFRRASIGR